MERKKYLASIGYTPRDFEFFDTTLRDGLQSPLLEDNKKYTLSTEEKLGIFDGLVSIGVSHIEVFAPIVGRRHREDLDAVVRRRDEWRGEGKTVYVAAHVRANSQDVEGAVQAGVDGLNMYMGTSDMSQKYNHGKTLEQIVGKVYPLLADIRKNHPHLIGRFSGEDASRTTDEQLTQVYDELADVVDRFGMPDTVGIAEPEEVTERVQMLRERYPYIDLEGHFHHDNGNSLHNTVAGVAAGMRFVDTSVLGLAERSGIASMGDVLFRLNKKYPHVLQGYIHEQMYPLNVLVAKTMNMRVPSREIVSLTNRTHSAGVHTAAVGKDTSTYEANNLARFGVTENQVLLGALSGVHTVGYFLEHMLGFRRVSEEKLREVTQIFKDTIHEKPQDMESRMWLRTIALSEGLRPRVDKTTHVERLTP